MFLEDISIVNVHDLEYKCQEASLSYLICSGKGRPNGSIPTLGRRLGKEYSKIRGQRETREREREKERGC